MKCFYHNDMDGHCAGAIVRQFTRNENKEDYIESDYSKPLNIDCISPGEVVYFVDYSFTKDTCHILDKLNGRNMMCTIIWIDHHKSSIELEKTNPEYAEIPGIRSDKESGAYLTWNFFNDCNKFPPYFVQLFSDYDCWHKKIKESDYFKLGIDSVPNDVFDIIWKNLICDDEISSITIESIINTGKGIKVFIDQDNKYYRDHYSYESEITGMKCLVANKKSNSWIFGDEINKYPIVIAWVFDGINYVYSLFSTDESVDCSDIARRYGGGGHKGAAGFVSKELLFKNKGDK